LKDDPQSVQNDKDGDRRCTGSRRSTRWAASRANGSTSSVRARRNTPGYTRLYLVVVFALAYAASQFKIPKVLIPQTVAARAVLSLAARWKIESHS
jgi:hypothetical protein